MLVKYLADDAASFHLFLETWPARYHVRAQFIDFSSRR